MNKDAVKNIALILLLGSTVFSLVRYVSELKARYRLQDSLIQAQGEVAVLTQEKQNLLWQMGKEKELKEQLALKNISLKGYLRASKNRIARLFRDNENTSAKFSILKAENRALIDSRKRRTPALETEGNRGYLLKQGQSTTRAKIKIEVVPAQTKE
ncbi:MAG: hypothetical protein WC616_04275 [Candidatus Omnitrophota bacterium]